MALHELVVSDHLSELLVLVCHLGRTENGPFERLLREALSEVLAVGVLKVVGESKLPRLAKAAQLTDLLLDSQVLPPTLN